MIDGVVAQWILTKAIAERAKLVLDSPEKAQKEPISTGGTEKGEFERTSTLHVLRQGHVAQHEG